jgi:hypothetical protein
MDEHIVVRPPETLNDFNDYEDYRRFAENLFSLDAQEYRKLYNVLLKLQGIGEDPKETMITWKKETCRKGCPEFIRFMIEVDDMDIKAIA